MQKFTGLLLCCFIVLSAGACTKEEGSEGTAEENAAMETTDVASVVGTWQITEWKADEIDQMEMWRIGNLTVQFRPDGSVESKLVYSNGDERTSGGTWKASDGGLEINVQGQGGVEGDEPFERTREFAIDELTTDVMAVHAEIETPDKPIVLTYRAQRVMASE